MNCKKGDMALVVRSYAGNCGKTVTCLEYLGDVRTYQYGSEVILLSKGNWWVVDTKLNMLENGKVIVDYAPLTRDDFLMPIGSSEAPVTIKETEEEPA